MTRKNTDTSRPEHWHRNPWFLLLIMLVSTLPFWLTNLDSFVSGLFYYPELANPWPVDRHVFWQFFYRGTPILTSILLFGSLAVLVLLRRSSKRIKLLRLYAMYVLLVVVIGPGLIVNGVLKGYWGRPRPSSTIIFGGDQQYIAPLAIGNDPGNKSFPSGHGSAGFALFAFWFIIRGRQRRYAKWTLMIVLSLAFLIGSGRIVGGAHYLSDVFWAGLIVYVVALMLYYHILKIPAREEQIDNASGHDVYKRGYKEPLAYGALGAGLIFISLLATPIKDDFTRQLNAATLLKLRHIDYSIDYGRVEVRVTDTANSIFDMTGRVRGFGFPSSKVNVIYNSDTPGVISSRIEHTGVFTEKNVRYVFSVDTRMLDKFSLSLEHGQITVTGKILENDRDKLNIKVQDGRILYR